MLRFRHTIRGKMVIGVSSTIILITLLMNTFIIIRERDTAKENANQHLINTLAFTSGAISHSLWDYDQDTVKENLLALMKVDYIAAITLSDENDSVIFSFEKPSLLELSSYLKQGNADIIFDDNYLGVLSVTVSSYYLEQSALREMQRNYLITVLTILFIILVIAKLTENITQPLLKLEKVALNIADGQLDNVIAVNREDEIGQLASTIQSMQSQLIEKHIEISKKVLELEQMNETVHDKNLKIENLYSEQLNMNNQLIQMVSEINSSYKITILALANSIEANDAYTRGHCDRVRQYALQIADVLHVTKEEKESLEYAAVLHDIGKIGIPNEILNKESQLTPAEYEQIKKHPAIGYDIIKDIPFLKKSAVIVLQHHERIDGKGYPNSLTEENINLLAQILCVADAYDAMTSARPYRKQPLTHETAMNQLTEGIHSQFNGVIVNALWESFNAAKGVEVLDS